MIPARHPIPRDEWNLARYLAKRGGLRPGEHVIHMRSGMTVIEGEGMSEIEYQLREAVAEADRCGGHPTRFAIQPDRVALALALGLEIEYVP
jgi:hypothetical protein